MMQIKHIIEYAIYLIPIKRLRWSLYKKYNLFTPKPILSSKIHKHFKTRTGYKLDIENPTTFNEKIQWLKLNYKNKIMPQCADKANVRKYIENKGLSQHLTQSFGVFNSYKHINFNELPDQFVIKVTHNSGGVFIIKDKSVINHQLLQKKIDQLISRPYEHGLRNGEWHYLHIPPQIIIEELLSDDESNTLLDYKFHCFNGQPQYIQVDVERQTNHTRVFYDTDWNNLHFTSQYPLSRKNIPKPADLEIMINIAKKLSNSFPYARIDLYSVKGKVYFGEITFFHGNGMEKFNPKKWDTTLGEKLNLLRR